ncbi:hypothetical protein DIPPA_32246 [Diplonema papillatum]|nr:hypothetical protein DIPPA_32246 [Diplonema papillatum]
MASRVDQLETTVNAVYGRLDLNTLSERAEKLRHQQEQLQQLQARRNEEHRSRSLQRVHMSASPLAASPSTIKATQPSNSQPLTSVPVNTLNSGQQFTTSTSIFGTPPRRLSSPHGSTTHPAGNHSVSPQSKSTYAKASDALARARQARATQYPSLFPPDPHPAHAPPQTPPTGRPTPPPPAGNSYFAQSRKISPTRKPDTSLNSSQNDHTREHRSGSPIPLGASLDGSLHFSQHTQSNATLAQNPSATTANHPSSKLDLSPQTLLEERRRLVAERAEEARVAAARIEALEKELTGMKTAALAGIDGKQSAAASRPEAKNSDGSPKATAKESMPSFPNSNSVFGEEEQGSAGAADDGTDKKAGSDGKKQQGGKRPSKEDRMAAVLSELQALQKQNQAMSSRLVQHEEAVTALHAITPKKASRTSTTPPRKRQAAGLGDSHNTALFTTPEKQAAHARYSPSSTSWSPSLIKIGAKADRSLRKPSEFQQASSEDWTKSKQSLDASRVKSRGRDVAKRPSETEKDNKGKRASTAVQRKSTSGSAGYAYTKKNLAEHRVKAKLTPRQSTDDLHKSSTLVSSLCIRVDTSDLPVRPTTSSATRVQRRTTSNLTAKKQATPWNPNTQPQPVILPPNRHRVTQRSQLSDTVTTVSGMATTPRDGTFKSVDTKADRLVIDATRQDTTTGHHETLTTVNRPPVGPRISNDRVREWGVEPAEEEDDDSQEDGSYELGAEQLILPLPACCKTLPLSDSGVSPYGLVQISHLHSVEVADHYAKWLTSVDASEQEEAIAILSILPLGSLPSEPAEALYSSVLDVLSRYDELPNSTIAQALRIVQLVTAGHGGFPSASAAFYVLSRILRSADHVALIPAVVNTYLSFGQRGLLVLLDEACCDPPSSDSAVHRQGVASGWNSLILTMIANKPAVLQSLVVPMVLRDLRDGTPERAEAACCVLMGLHRYKPPVLAQLGEALVAGKFDRRLACIAIRVIGGTESVSLLQSLTSHPSHRVRQAAVWGLGLHAPYHHDTNVDFEEAFRDHQPYPALPKLRSRSSVVVHADLASLQQQANPAHHPSTPILYFQPQVEPDCPPYVETHVICDPTVILSQCRTFAQNGVLDLSVGEHNPVAPPSPTSYPRHSFVALASALVWKTSASLLTST